MQVQVEEAGKFKQRFKFDQREAGSSEMMWLEDIVSAVKSQSVSQIIMFNDDRWVMMNQVQRMVGVQHNLLQHLEDDSLAPATLAGILAGGLWNFVLTRSDWTD